MAINPITAALAVVSTATTVRAGQKANQAAKASNQALASQEKMADLNNLRERRALLREARIKAGQSRQAAVNQGVAGSSVSQGALTDIATQVEANISFLDEYRRLGREAAAFNTKANKLEQSAKTWSAVGGLAKQAAGVDWGNLFKKPKGS